MIHYLIPRDEQAALRREAIAGDAMDRLAAIEEASEAARAKVRAIVEEFADVVDQHSRRGSFDRAEIAFITDAVMELVEDSAATITNDLKDRSYGEDE